MISKLTKITLTIICLKLGLSAKSQDIYNSAHSYQYATYLFKSKEFSRAAHEYQRACFLDSQNWVAHFYLIQSYRKSGQENKGISHFTKIQLQLPKSEKLKFEHESNICRFRTKPNYFETKTEADSVGSLPYFKGPALLMSHKWADSRAYISSTSYKENKTLNNYYQLACDGININYKKPWLAGTLSTIVPGLGKFYTGYTKDGLIALLMTSISGYQAYRGYSGKGARSGIFIIYTGMAAGFYLGNIYGSIKSAKQKNSRLNEMMDAKTKEIFYEWAE